MENDWLISGHETLRAEKLQTDMSVYAEETNARRMRAGEIRLNTEFHTAPAGCGPYKLHAGEWMEV